MCSSDLFYAKGGQGGSTGGGQAQGVGLPSTTPTMARIQAQGRGEQTRKNHPYPDQHQGDKGR